MPTRTKIDIGAREGVIMEINLQLHVIKNFINYFI